MFDENYVIGGQIATIAFVAQLVLSKPYDEVNFKIQKVINKIICGAYAVGFFILATGMRIFGEDWWVTVLTYIIGMMALGAAIEFFKKYPLASKSYQSSKE